MAETTTQSNCSILLVSGCSSGGGGDSGGGGGLHVVEQTVDCNEKYSFICNVTSKGILLLRDFFRLFLSSSSDFLR